MKKSLIYILPLFIFLLTAGVAGAMPIHGFETAAVGATPAGAILLGGNGATVENGAGFTGGGIAATEGSQFAYLTTGPEENGSTPSPFDQNSNGENEYDWALMNLTFSGVAGDILSLDYDVLTSEFSEEVADIFSISLDGNFLETGAIESPSGTFPAVDGFSGEEIAGPDGSVFEDGRLGWTSLSIALGSSGMHTLSFYVGDETDDIVDTALLVDNIQLNAAQVPEPGTLLLLGFGLVGLASIKFKIK